MLPGATTNPCVRSMSGTTVASVGSDNAGLEVPTLATVVPLIDLTQGLVVAPGNITIVP